MRALVLLSGGLDSTTLLAYAKSKHLEVTGLIFDYGQIHDRELKSAVKVTERLQLNSMMFRIDLHSLDSALLKGSEKAIPQTEVEGVPNTYVPFRNVIFLSIACGIAESFGYDTILYGANAVDFSGYPDCRPSFVYTFMDLIKTLNPKLALEAPLLMMSKSEIIEFGLEHKAPFELTWSCYRGGKLACGKCPSCHLRLKGFAEAGVKDPIEYE